MSEKHSKKAKNKKNSKNELVKVKKEKVKFSKKHPKLTIALRILLLIIVILVVVGAGVVVGMIYGGWGDDFEITKEELVIATSNSVILDKDGNKLAELSGDENRKIVKLDQMPENLKNAYVAIEDERFYKHNGVDIKRTGAAIVQYILHRGKSSFGGSTITQQLVKNITKDDEKSGIEGILRKVKEWAKAYQIERMLSKDQILELYLNIIFVGGNQNNLGVEVGSEYYFNKQVGDLSLAECAFLAGINNSPNSYNPYGQKDRSELIKKRTKTVLGKMKELGKVSQEEYDEAVKQVDDGLNFQKSESMGSVYSYHTDATIAQVIEDIANEKGISKSLASTYVYSSGLTIYSTQDTALQEKMDEVMVKNSSQYAKKSSKTGATTQSAMVVIDNATGYVVGVEGGLGEKKESRGLNRATQSTRQTGSSIKPLTSLVPGISEGVITAATIYDDSSTDFKIKNWSPKDYNAFQGLISIRSAATTSQNIPFIKVVDELTTAKSAEYLERMGVTSLTDTDKSSLAAIAIGGLSNGITPLEMAGAYATIANNGVYREPMFYTKVTDVNGNTYLGANLQVYLNKMYYGGVETTCYNGADNSETTCPTNTLDRTAKLLIDKHTWSLGAIEMSIEDTISFYNAERGTANGKTCTSGTYCNDTVIRTTKWTGYVALPYITDWAYASSESACETNIQTKDSSNLFVCKNNNWMQRSDWTWYLSPSGQSADASNAWAVSGNNNYVYYRMFGAMNKFASYGSNVAPSIYLKSSVLMKGGSGTSSDPYKLA